MKVRTLLDVFTILVTLAAGAQGLARGSELGSCDGSVSKLTAMEGFRGIRVIEDPANHRHWLIERDIDHPGRPARAIQTPDGYLCPVRANQEQKGVMVHAGDGLLIVEDSPVCHAELEAEALNNGGYRDSIMVRLRIGGKVVRGVVEAPGRAVLATYGIESYR